MSHASTSDAPSKQQLWPFLVVGLALMGIGFYFVFNDTADVAEESAERVPAVEAVEVAAAPAAPAAEPVEPVELRLRARAARYALRLDREVERVVEGEESAPLRTRLAMTVVDEPRSVSEAVPLVFDRGYEDVLAGVYQGPRRVGAEVTGEVERLLAAAAHRVSVEPNGKLVDYALVSSEAAQLRQTLDIVADALVLATPRFPRAKVNVGESWTYRLPAEISDPASAVEVGGETVVENTLVGFETREGRRLAVVEQTYGAELRGRFRPKEATGGEAGAEAAGPATAFTGTSRGEGRYLFDVEAGQVAHASGTIEAEMGFGGQAAGTASRTSFSLRRGAVP